MSQPTDKHGGNVAALVTRQIPRVWLALDKIDEILQAYVYVAAITETLNRTAGFSIPEIDGCLHMLKPTVPYVQRSVSTTHIPYTHQWDDNLLASAAHGDTQVDVLYLADRSFVGEEMESGLYVTSGPYALLGLYVFGPGYEESVTGDPDDVYYIVVRWDTAADRWRLWNENWCPATPADDPQTVAAATYENSGQPGPTLLAALYALHGAR